MLWDFLKINLLFGVDVLFAFIVFICDFIVIVDVGPFLVFQVFFFVVV